MTAIQEKFKRIRPWPVGCVFIEHPGMSEADIRRHFRLMRELGFTALKQCQTCRGMDRRRVMHIALDEGIIPFWFGEAGWEDPTPQLLSSIGLDPAMSIGALREHPTWLARQEKLMRDRIDGKLAGVSGNEDYGQLWAGEPIEPPVALSFDDQLTDAHVGPFIAWLQKSYETIERLNRAWNLHHCMIAGPGGESGEYRESGGYRDWDHLRADLPATLNREIREYRRIRDVLRFKADIYLDHVRYAAHQARKRDPNAPFRAGGEMGLFLAFASRATDMEGIANLMYEQGSFYPSIHLAWHFEEVGFETVRPLYMQASIAADWFRGGWSATWESTGGPQQLTGGKAPFVPSAANETPGFTVDEGVMTQAMLSWIAGGFRGFGLWCWNTRTAGWEAGEYSLLDRNNRPGPRARIAGRIGSMCRKYRDELWQCEKRPVVGIFQDWENEAIWAAASRGGRDHWKSEPIRARIGCARALINGNVPFEHVTARQLARDASRYRTIYLPAILSLSDATITSLRSFVEQGGRVILDAPGAWYDDFAQLRSTDDNSTFERLFGVRIADVQYSREGNRVWSIGQSRLDGACFSLEPTQAKVIERFDHGQPAVTSHAIGRGEAIVLGWSASLEAWKPGRVTSETWIRHLSCRGVELPYACEGAIAYRLVGPGVQHYFVLNDGPAVRAKLAVRDRRVQAVRDVIADEAMNVGSTIEVDLPGHDGRWIRVSVD